MSQPYQIIAVDFDRTLCFSNWPNLGEPNRPLIEYLKQMCLRQQAHPLDLPRRRCPGESCLLVQRSGSHL